MNSFDIVFSYQGPCDRFTHTRTTTVDGTTRLYTLTGLQEFSTYTINITAANDGGRSAVTSPSVTTIAAGRSYFSSVLLLAFFNYANYMTYMYGVLHNHHPQLDPARGGDCEQL